MSEQYHPPQRQWNVLQHHTLANIVCMLLSVLHGYLAQNSVALCCVQGQAQECFRIILMPWLLPGNSCPEREMNGCPWALFHLHRSFLLTASLSEIMFSIDVVWLQHFGAASLPRQIHQIKMSVWGGWRHDSYHINPTDVIEGVLRFTRRKNL